VPDQSEDESGNAEETPSIYDAPWTCLLIISNTIIFIVFAVSKSPDSIVFQWGFTPNRIMQISSLPTLITHMFLHGDILHLFINMLIFLQFGILCESKVYWYEFLTLYFGSGVFAAVFHAFFNLRSDIPCIGASGAIFGILAGAALLYPEREAYLFIGFIPTKIRLLDGVVIAFVVETLYAFVGLNPYIAHFAHIGGGIAGALITAVLSREARELLKSMLGLYESYRNEERDI